MKHKIKTITDLPWDLGPKFDKPKNCRTVPPIQILKILAEAQAAEKKKKKNVYIWWTAEEKSNE